MIARAGKRWQELWALCFPVDNLRWTCYNGACTESLGSGVKEVEVETG
jgi:hypothetical protein